MVSGKIDNLIEPINSSFVEVANRLIDIEPTNEIIEIPKNYQRSPLRYPGGKNRAIKSIYSFIPKNEKKLCSPFLGGGSIELACTTKMYVYGYDIFAPLIDFWQVLLNERDNLVKCVRKYYPLSKTKFYNLQKRYINLESSVERAAAFFVLNRASFSGTTLSGGMSPGHPRFTESAIERLNTFEVKNFTVNCADYREVIPKHDDAFLYLDPPYMNGHALYGIRGDTHKGFDHEELSKLLHKRDRWIMSYNDCSEIRELYKDNQILSLEWIYGMAKNKQSNEILVLSNDLNLAA